MGELARHPDRLVIGDPGPASRARHVERKGEVLSFTTEPRSPQERPLERLGIELSGDLRRHLARTRVDHDGPLRQVSVADRGESADDLHALERVRRNLAQIDPAPCGCRETDSGSGPQRLQVRVVGDGDAVQDDHRAEAGEIVGANAPGARGRRRAQSELLNAPEPRRFERHAREEFEDPGQRSRRLILDRLQIDDAGRGQFTAGPAYRIHGHREALQFDRPRRHLQVPVENRVRGEGEWDTQVRESDSADAYDLRARRDVDEPIGAGGIAESGEIGSLDTHNGAVDRPPCRGLQHAARNGPVLCVQRGRKAADQAAEDQPPLKCQNLSQSGASDRASMKSDQRSC